MFQSLHIKQQMEQDESVLTPSVDILPSIAKEILEAINIYCTTRSEFEKVYSKEAKKESFDISTLTQEQKNALWSKYKKYYNKDRDLVIASDELKRIRKIPLFISCNKTTFLQYYNNKSSQLLIDKTKSRLLWREYRAYIRSLENKALKSEFYWSIEERNPDVPTNIKTVKVDKEMNMQLEMLYTRSLQGRGTEHILHFSVDFFHMYLEEIVDCKSRRIIRIRKTGE